MSFDYEVLHTCQYGVAAVFDVSDCGEPAPYKVWWDDYGRDAMYVWEKHFDFIKTTEEASNE